MCERSIDELVPIKGADKNGEAGYSVLTHEKADLINSVQLPV